MTCGGARAVKADAPYSFRSNAAFIDALRDCLDLDPLYRKAAKTMVERFGVTYPDIAPPRGRSVRDFAM